MTEESIRTLKTDDCPSLSGRSDLSYKIGCKGKEVFLCLAGNSGGGKFNKEWVPLAQILSSEETQITSGSLRTIFKGKSANSAGFMLAVLVAEGLVKISEDAKTYERIDPREFQKGIQALMDAKKENRKKVSPKVPE